MRILLVPLFLAGTGFAVVAAEPFNSEPAPGGPLPAAEAAAKWKWPAGFEVSVFATEPAVQQPIAMAVDHRGRLWVAECYSYAEHRTGWEKELRDRIVILEDTDGDGVHDRRTVFCEGLQKLTSLEVGLGGVWALALPQMIFLPDADGDDRPDGPPVVKLDGFEFKVSHHTVANGLRWGPDGWLYGRHGIQAVSAVGAPGTPQADRLKMNVGIWRYHPARGVVEWVCSGTTNPWGMDWNADGEAFFINTVIGHLWHVIPGAHYRRMYGSDPYPWAYDLMEQHADHVHWAAGEAWNDWQKIGTSEATSEAGGGHAHTGLLFYQGSNWPSEWQGKLLTINFNGRRINVENVVPEGSGYVGKRAPDIGFAADTWFRGIDLVAAADGGVFVADWSDTGECHDDTGVHRLSGRIFKIVYKGSGALRPEPVPSDLAFSGLARGLISDHAFVSRQSRLRLQDLAAHGKVGATDRQLLKQSFQSAQNPRERLRLLWGLVAIQEATPEFLRSLLTDPDPRLRVHAIRFLLDDPIAAGADPATRAALSELAAREAAPPARLALASALQRVPVDWIPAIAQPLLTREEDAADHNLPYLLWYGVSRLGEANPMALADLVPDTRMPLVRRNAARRLGSANRQAAGPALQKLLLHAAHAGNVEQQDIFKGLHLALEGQRSLTPPPGWPEASLVFSKNSDPQVQESFRKLEAIFADPKALAALADTVRNPQANPEKRREALESLLASRNKELKELCLAVLSDANLRNLAASGLAMEEDPALADRILQELSKVKPGTDASLIAALISRPEWARRLLAAVAEKRVEPERLSVFHLRQIQGFKDTELNEGIRRQWGEVNEPGASAAEAVAKWKRILTPVFLKDADRAAGQKIFLTACGTCHVLNGAGAALGPELTGSNRDNLDYLLQNIVDPGSVVAPGFQLTTITLKDGRILAGTVKDKAGAVLSLQTLAGPQLIPVQDISSQETNAVSLMPPGLLESLGETAVRDLIGYLMAK